MRGAPGGAAGGAIGAACPSDPQLESALSDLGGEAGSAVGVHVRGCAACTARLEGMRRDVALLNEFARAERGSGAGASGGTVAGSPHAARVSGEYQIVSELHRGGQGVVFRAVQKSTGRAVALKMLLHGALATERQRLRFDREIELASRLSHPGIAAVYAGGVTGEGQPYLVMPLVEGVRLDEFAASAARGGGPAERRRARDKVLGVFGGVCGAVAYAHQRGVIHRDLKPSNVLVDRDGTGRVLDFGLAKAVGADEPARGLSVAGEFMGTLAYASPEHVRGDPDAIDVRSDVYSLGVMLYELLSGRSPYPEGVGSAELVRAIQERSPEPPSRVEAARFPLDHELDTIVLKAMAKDPSRRYQSAGELGGDVERYLRGEAIDAKRDSAAYVARKFVSRHRAGVGAGAMFVVLIAGFGGATAVQVGSSRVDLQACKLEYSIVSPK